MNRKFILIFAIFTIAALSSALAEESNYIRKNKDPKWALTSDVRLIQIINNPKNYNPEEFMAALHEYSKRHGVFEKARNSLQAIVNAYIAFNPDYREQSTEEIFIWTARSRGVPSLQGFEDIPDDNSFEKDLASIILAKFDESGYSLELTSEGSFDNDVTYTVYLINGNIKMTVSTDENGVKYIIGNVYSFEAMQEVLDFLTKTFSEPVPYLNGGFQAVFSDTENLYIKDDLTDYIGTFTIYGSQMFAEEVIPEDKIITQRQWCTPDFFDVCISELGQGWGFIASWDEE